MSISALTKEANKKLKGYQKQIKKIQTEISKTETSLDDYYIKFKLQETKLSEISEQMDKLEHKEPQSVRSYLQIKNAEYNAKSDVAQHYLTMLANNSKSQEDINKEVELDQIHSQAFEKLLAAKMGYINNQEKNLTVAKYASLEDEFDVEIKNLNSIKCTIKVKEENITKLKNNEAGLNRVVDDYLKHNNVEVATNSQSK